MCELSDTHPLKFVPFCLPPLYLGLIQGRIPVSDLPSFVVGCPHLEKTICTLMAATLTALGLPTSQDVTQYTRARPMSTDLVSLMKDAGAPRIPRITTQSLGLASDLRVVHLVLPGGEWTIEMSRTRSLLVVHPVLPAFHLRDILARLHRAGHLPHRHPLFALPESDQSLRLGLASVLIRLFDHLLTLVPILRNLLYECPFSEVTLLANSVVEVAVNELACVTRQTGFETPSQPLLCHLCHIQMSRGLTMASPFTLLSLYVPLRLLSLLGLVDDPAYLNVLLPALRKVDTTIPKLIEVNYRSDYGSLVRR